MRRSRLIPALELRHVQSLSCRAQPVLPAVAMLPAGTRTGSVLAGYRSWSAGPMELARHRAVTVVSEQGLHCSKAVPPADWSAVARNSFRFHVLDRRQSCHAAAKVQPAREQMTHSCSARVAVARFVVALSALQQQAGLETGD
jgi:hypothetical protein